MHFLFLNHNIVRRGGTFYRAYHAGRYLVRRGHVVTLLTISENKRWGFECEVSEGVEIVHTPDLMWGAGRSGWDPWDTINRVAYLRGKQWDIIHAWDCRPAVILPALYARRQSRGIDGKLIIDWADWWGRGGTQAERPGKFAKILYSPIETYFEESFRKYADGTTVASKALQDRAMALGVPDDSIMILPGGSDTDTISCVSKEYARTRLGFPVDKHIVGYMGAITVKEVKMLLSSLSFARERIPDLHFLAIGMSIAGSNFSFRSLLESSETKWIIEIGRVPFEQVGAYLSACDALMLPLRQNISNSARWPSKVNDYLSAGRPIVATQVGEMKPLFENHIGLATEDNEKSFANGLINILCNPEQAREFGQNARLLAEEELNWSQIVSDLEEFYRRV